MARRALARKCISDFLSAPSTQELGIDVAARRLIADKYGFGPSHASYSPGSGGHGDRRPGPGPYPPEVRIRVNSTVVESDGHGSQAECQLTARAGVRQVRSASPFPLR